MSFRPQQDRNTRRPPVNIEAAVVRESGLDALLRHSPDGLLISSERGQIIFASQVAAQALGFDSPGALMATPPSDLAQRFVIEEPSGAAAPDAPLPGHELLRGLPEPDRLLRFRDPEQGWDRWVLLRTAPSAKHVGKKPTVLTMVRDISLERRRENSALFLEEAASRLSRSLSEDRVLQHAAVVAVPRLGDECVVVARDEDRSSGGLAALAWHIPTDPGGQRARGLAQRFAPLVAQVEASGRPMILEPTSVSGTVVLAPVTCDPKREDVTAVLLLAMAQDTGRRHHPQDIALAEQLGRRVAHALSNARLLESEQRRRHLSEESEAVARHLSQALQSRLGTLQRELEGQLEPLLKAASLLERPGTGPQRQLVDIVKRQTEHLRALAINLREAPAALETAEITVPVATRAHGQ